MRWAVEGCTAWQTHGLGEPPAVVHATGDYRDREDRLKGFIRDHCITGPDLRVRASWLLRDFREWSADRNLSAKKFGDMMSEHGYSRITSNGVWYLGLRTTAEGVGVREV